MSLNSIIRSGVAIADAITKDLQGTVMHSAWISQSAFGKPTYGRRVSGLDITGSFDTPDVAVGREAVIEQKQRIRDVQGRNVLTFVHLTFVGPIPVNGMGTERKEAVDTRDVFVLPDGTTGPVVDVVGVVDSETNLMYAVEVWLGDTTSARGGGGSAQ
jgi:hypothetical protein